MFVLNTVSSSKEQVKIENGAGEIKWVGGCSDRFRIIRLLSGIVVIMFRLDVPNFNFSETYLYFDSKCYQYSQKMPINHKPK